MYDWLSTVNDKFWLILNYSKVVWDIDTKFSPVVVIISFQLSTKFGASSYTQNGFPAKTILNFKRAWRAHFLSHTCETQEICCFLADVQIILVSLFELFDYIKVAKKLKPSSPGVQSFLASLSEGKSWLLSDLEIKWTWTFYWPAHGQNMFLCILYSMFDKFTFMSQIW